MKKGRYFTPTDEIEKLFRLIKCDSLYASKTVEDVEKKLNSGKRVLTNAIWLMRGDFNTLVKTCDRILECIEKEQEPEVTDLD